MLVGLGIDIVELDRIQDALDRHGQRFVERVLTPAERETLPSGNITPFLAARFAAKEAASKALGTGMRDGVGFQTIQVRREPSGKPALELLGPALELARTLGAERFHLSLTHGRDTAAAVAILESASTGKTI